MSGLESYREENLDFAQLLRAGHIFYGEGKLPKAKAIYFEALRAPHIEGEGLFELYKNLGNIFLQEGDVASAEENYNRAHTINNCSDVLMVNFGSVAIFRQNLARAVQCFRDAVKINPRNAKAWAGLATIHREFGDHELAWANAERALDIDPNLDIVLQLVAEWSFKDNEIEKGIHLLGQHIAASPSNHKYRVTLAKFYYLAGHLDAARREAMAVLETDPNNEAAEFLFSSIRNEMAARSVRFG